MNLYASVFDFYGKSAGPLGLEVNSLVGNVARLSGSHILGATSLTVAPSTTVQLEAYDDITIFDGALSESVVVASTVQVGSSSIPLQSGLQNPHSSGTAWCSDGIMGSLADCIIDGSAELENIIQQSLWEATHSETIRMPSMRASIDEEQRLVIIPNWQPVNSVSAISVKAYSTLSAIYNVLPVIFDPTQVIYDIRKQIIYVPWLIAGFAYGETYYSLLPTVLRTTKLFLTVTYDAGYSVSTMPGAIRQAAVLLASDYLSKRLNPSGAADISSGARRLSPVIRTDLAGESLLYKRALRLLSHYTNVSF